jgi:hypothetical protein
MAIHTIIFLASNLCEVLYPRYPDIASLTAKVVFIVIPRKSDILCENCPHTSKYLMCFQVSASCQYWSKYTSEQIMHAFIEYSHGKVIPVHGLLLFWFPLRPSMASSAFEVLSKIPNNTCPSICTVYGNIIHGERCTRSQWELPIEAGPILQSLAAFAVLPILNQCLPKFLMVHTQLWLLLSILFHLLLSYSPVDKPLSCTTLISALVPLNCFSSLLDRPYLTVKHLLGNSADTCAASLVTVGFLQK